MTDSPFKISLDQAVRDCAMNPKMWASCNKPHYIKAKGFDGTVAQFEAMIAAERKSIRGAVSASPIDTRNAKSVPWLYTGRFPGGKLTILDGDPGLSKSMFSLGLSVSVLTGKKFLGLIKPETTGGVVLLSAEDDLDDTIIPRLLAAGCPHGVVPNLLHIPCIKSNGLQFSLADPFDREDLKDIIKSIDAKLVVIDPLNAYLGDKADSHNDQKMRQVLGPLSDMANQTGAMILGLRHLNKAGGGKAIYRGLGSIGYTAAARANFFAAEHPEEPGNFVVAASKFNLGPKPSSFKYKLAFAEVPGVSGLVPYVANGEFCDLSANDLAAAQSEEANSGGKLKEAIDFLQERLSNGPVKAKDLEKAAFKEGVKQATLRRAKDRLKIKSTQMKTDWYWDLTGAPREPRDPNAPGPVLVKTKPEPEQPF
jgi:putative DNA primase/helicase